jgi:hypothetical protein
VSHLSLVITYIAESSRYVQNKISFNEIHLALRARLAVKS